MPAASPLPPVKVAQLHFLDLIGKGSRGQIFSAEDEGGRLFAVKVMPRHDGDAVVEAACLARVSDGHPNIIGVAGGGVEHSSDSTFVVLERCDSDLLELILATGCGLEEAVAARLYAQVVRAVRHCHKLGVYHGDIKPENALLLFTHGQSGSAIAPAPHTAPDPTATATATAATDQEAAALAASDEVDTVVKLCDFGSASLTRITSKAAGSVPYAAPEVLPLFHAHYDGGVAVPLATPIVAVPPPHSSSSSVPVFSHPPFPALSDVVAAAAQAVSDTPGAQRRASAAFKHSASADPAPSSPIFSITTSPAGGAGAPRSPEAAATAAAPSATAGLRSRTLGDPSSAAAHAEPPKSAAAAAATAVHAPDALHGGGGGGSVRGMEASAHGHPARGGAYGAHEGAALLLSASRTEDTAFAPPLSVTGPSDIRGGSYVSSMEHRTSAPYDAAAADVWSLGILLYVLLTGSPPFGEASMRDPAFASLVMGRWRPPDDFPPGAARLLFRILRIRPAMRPSVADVYSDEWLAGARADARRGRHRDKRTAAAAKLMRGAPQQQQQQPHRGRRHDDMTSAGGGSPLHARSDSLGTSGSDTYVHADATAAATAVGASSRQHSRDNGPAAVDSSSSSSTLSSAVGASVDGTAVGAALTVVPVSVAGAARSGGSIPASSSGGSGTGSYVVSASSGGGSSARALAATAAASVARAAATKAAALQLRSTVDHAHPAPSEQQQLLLQSSVDYAAAAAAAARFTLESGPQQPQQSSCALNAAAPTAERAHESTGSEVAHEGEHARKAAAAASSSRRREREGREGGGDSGGGDTRGNTSTSSGGEDGHSSAPPGVHFRTDEAAAAGGGGDNDRNQRKEGRSCDNVGAPRRPRLRRRHRGSTFEPGGTPAGAVGGTRTTDGEPALIRRSSNDDVDESESDGEYSYDDGTPGAGDSDAGGTPSAVAASPPAAHAGTAPSSSSSVSDVLVAPSSATAIVDAENTRDSAPASRNGRRTMQQQARHQQQQEKQRRRRRRAPVLEGNVDLDGIDLNDARSASPGPSPKGEGDGGAEEGGTSRGQQQQQQRQEQQRRRVDLRAQAPSDVSPLMSSLPNGDAEMTAAGSTSGGPTLQPPQTLLSYSASESGAEATTSAAAVAHPSPATAAGSGQHTTPATASAPAPTPSPSKSGLGPLPRFGGGFGLSIHVSRPSMTEDEADELDDVMSTISAAASVHSSLRGGSESDRPELLQQQQTFTSGLNSSAGSSSSRMRVAELASKFRRSSSLGVLASEEPSSIGSSEGDAGSAQLLQCSHERDGALSGHEHAGSAPGSCPASLPDTSSASASPASTATAAGGGAIWLDRQRAGSVDAIGRPIVLQGSLLPPSSHGRAHGAARRLSAASAAGESGALLSVFADDFALPADSLLTSATEDADLPLGGGSGGSSEGDALRGGEIDTRRRAPHEPALRSSSGCGDRGGGAGTTAPPVRGDQGGGGSAPVSTIFGSGSGDSGSKSGDSAGGTDNHSSVTSSDGPASSRSHSSSERSTGTRSSSGSDSGDDASSSGPSGSDGEGDDHPRAARRKRRDRRAGDLGDGDDEEGGSSTNESGSGSSDSSGSESDLTDTHSDDAGSRSTPRSGGSPSPQLRTTTTSTGVETASHGNIADSR